MKLVTSAAVSSSAVTPHPSAFHRIWGVFDAPPQQSEPIPAPFLTYARNTALIAVLVVIGTLMSCTLAAYGFARVQWPGREIVFVLVLSTMMLPAQVTLVPLYIIFTRTLHWSDTFYPLIVPAFFANAFDIFLLRQFFKSIPLELSDAPRVDGANEWQIFTQVVLPLSTPVLATVAVLTFLYS